MKRVIIVQARVHSSRLPGKVLLDLAGRPMLERQLERLKQCRAADDMIVATTRHGDDRPIVSLAGRMGVRWFRGSADDVLRRYVDAASQTQAEVVVRITADCPLIDPGVTDRVIRGPVRRAGRVRLRQQRGPPDVSARPGYRGPVCRHAAANRSAGSASRTNANT